MTQLRPRSFSISALQAGEPNQVWQRRQQKRGTVIGVVKGRVAPGRPRPCTCPAEHLSSAHRATAAVPAVPATQQRRRPTHQAVNLLPTARAARHAHEAPPQAHLSSPVKAPPLPTQQFWADTEKSLRSAACSNRQRQAVQA